MDQISFIFPNEEMESKALDFRNEFFENSEKTINGCYKLDMDKYTYSEWLQIIRDNLDEDTSNPKFGTSHTFFAIRDDGKIVGIINFRHKLTDFYKDSGHIGYSVRPSERKKGYATEILRQMLEFAQENELSIIYLVCKKSNEASRKTILKHGGELHRLFAENEIEYEEYTIRLT